MKTWKASQDHIRFAETDMFGWVHNSNFLRFVENAEHELLGSIGESPINAKYGWPRVNFTIDFRSPLTFGDPYHIELSLGRLGTSSVTWDFIIYSGSRLIAEGKMTSVQVNMEKKPIPIEDELRTKIEGIFS